MPDSHMFALCTGVSAPQALVLICMKNDFFAITRLADSGGVSCVCVCVFACAQVLVPHRLFF